MAMNFFAIFDQDMTQKIYENYVGILRMTEIQVALQPRAKRIIPLIEKEHSLEKEFWIRSRMEMTRSWDDQEDGKPL